MAGGWFTRTHLPAKLAAAGGPDWQVLEPLGCDPAVHDLAAQTVHGARAACLILPRMARSAVRCPSDIAYAIWPPGSPASGIPAEAAFIDQDPQLSHGDRPWPR